MPLRIATLEIASQDDAPRSPREWQRIVGRTAATAAGAVQAGNAEGLAAAYEAVNELSDPQRAFQTRRLITEAVFSESASLEVAQWRKIFAVAADELLIALGREPSEPVFLNYAGVLLYELGELGGADALFRAARKLDPTLPHVDGNINAVRALKRQGGSVVPFGASAASMRSLGLRARRVAHAARPARGLTISLCMIVKDEEEMLPGCLEAVAGAVDEIVVVDTGSSDRTVEIAESFGAKVLHFPWNGSFSDARNVGLEAATGDWLFYLDADEHLVPEDAQNIRRLLGRTWREGFHLVETNYTGTDETGTAVTHLALRIFRNRPEYRFEGRIHEQKTNKMPTYLPERFEATQIRIRHYGYLKSRISAKEKSRRNIELLLQEAKDAPSPFTEFNLGSEYMMLGDAPKAAEHFDRAWSALHETDGDWTIAGYAPILASRIAMARRASGRVADARAALDVGIKAMPDHTDLHLELAYCARADGDLAEAERIARRCLELGDAPARYTAIAGCGTFLALCLLAELADAQGRHDEAEALYLRSLAEYPTYVAPVLPAAVLLARRGAGLDEMRTALPLDRPSATLLAGTACLETGRVDDAVVLFEETLDRQPANDAARIGLSEAQLARSAWDAAVDAAALVPADSPLAAAAAGETLFARAASGDEAALRAAVAEASARVAQGDLALYTAWADRIAGRDGARPPVTSLPTALTALEALLRVQAFTAFEQLAAVVETIAMPPLDRRDALARIYLRRGFLDSAAEEWMTSAREHPSARALVGLAQVAYARSLPADAVVFAEHALQLEPENDQAVRLLEHLRAA
jgi:tetratricopeptide (TPR) repeat protein